MAQLKFPTSLEDLKKVPAFTIGVTIFSALFFVIYPSGSDTLLLKPSSPLKFDLNAISFYIFVHLDLFHLIFNLVPLVALLARYEQKHGTIYTGVTMNILAVVTALQYCLLGLVLYPNEKVGGLLGIVFSLLSFYCYKEHFTHPVLHTFKFRDNEFPIPTLYFPFINLCAIAILIPNSSFFGHLAAINTGFLLGLGKISFMFPPSRIIVAIESKLQWLIGLINSIVCFHSEEEAVNERGVTYDPLLSKDIENGEQGNPGYEGFERRLGN